MTAPLVSVVYGDEGEVSGLRMCVGATPFDEVLPKWIAREPKVTADTMVNANSSWKAVLEGTPALTIFREAHPNATPVTFFYDTFYGAMFDAAPELQQLFQGGMVAKSRALVAMMARLTSLTEVSEGQTFHSEVLPALHAIADRHLEYGILCHHYGIMGQALLNALETCMGPELWNGDVHIAWLNLLSLTLLVMIPRAAQTQAGREDDGGSLGGLTAKRFLGTLRIPTAGTWAGRGSKSPMTATASRTCGSVSPVGRGAGSPPFGLLPPSPVESSPAVRAPLSYHGGPEQKKRLSGGSTGGGSQGHEGDGGGGNSNGQARTPWRRSRRRTMGEVASQLRRDSSLERTRAAQASASETSDASARSAPGSGGSAWQVRLESALASTVARLPRRVGRRERSSSFGGSGGNSPRGQPDSPRSCPGDGHGGGGGSGEPRSPTGAGAPAPGGRSSPRMPRRQRGTGDWFGLGNFIGGGSGGGEVKDGRDMVGQGEGEGNEGGGDEVKEHGRDEEGADAGGGVDGSGEGGEGAAAAAAAAAAAGWRGGMSPGGTLQELPHVLVDKPQAVVEQGLEIKGDIRFKRFLRVDGDFTGCLTCTDGEDQGCLRIGPEGVVTADVSGLAEVMVEGCLNGSVQASFVLLRDTAFVKGDIRATTLQVDPGVCIQGVVTTATPRAASRRESFRQRNGADRPTSLRSDSEHASAEATTTAAAATASDPAFDDHGVGDCWGTPTGSEPGFAEEAAAVQKTPSPPPLPPRPAGEEPHMSATNGASPGAPPACKSS